MKNLNFLSDRTFKIDHLFELEDYIINSDNEIIVSKYKNFWKIDYNYGIDWYKVYADFIELGKLLFYEYKDDIEKYHKNQAACTYLVNVFDNKYKCNNNKRTVNVVNKWLKGRRRIVYLTELDQNSNKMKVELDYLTDLALFSFIVLSVINNYYLSKDVILKTKEGRKKYNVEMEYRKLLTLDIFINNFTDFNNNDLSSFLTFIIQYMDSFEKGGKNSIFGERSKLIYDNDIKYIRVYSTIYGLYWFILKMHIYSMYHGYKIINMCECGTIINSRAEKCDDCKRLIDKIRKWLERHPEQKKETN